jgi:Arc/MetJ-type ribon-helix-helix transcriptional regulator
MIAPDGCSALLDRVRGMMVRHTLEDAMPKTKVAVTVDTALLGRVDELVAARRFANRSQAVETALADTVARVDRTRLARECAKVNPREEQARAEAGFAGSRDTWPVF